MSKNIQIPFDLFTALLRYFFCEDEEAAKDCKAGLQAKLDSMIQHDLYTEYKTAPTPEQRETARQKYLEKAGIPKIFRW